MLKNLYYEYAERQSNDEWRYNGIVKYDLRKLVELIDWINNKWSRTKIKIGIPGLKVDGGNILINPLRAFDFECDLWEECKVIINDISHDFAHRDNDEWNTDYYDNSWHRLGEEQIYIKFEYPRHKQRWSYDELYKINKYYEKLDSRRYFSKNW